MVKYTASFRDAEYGDDRAAQFAVGNLKFMAGGVDKVVRIRPDLDIHEDETSSPESVNAYLHPIAHEPLIHLRAELNDRAKRNPRSGTFMYATARWEKDSEEVYYLTRDDKVASPHGADNLGREIGTTFKRNKEEIYETLPEGRQVA